MHVRQILAQASSHVGLRIQSNRCFHYTRFRVLGLGGYFQGVSSRERGRAEWREVAEERSRALAPGPVCFLDGSIGGGCSSFTGPLA